MLVYTVYQTTNLINGKIYVGVHKTTDPNDSYLGSGKVLKMALKKYGPDNFQKEILFVFETLEEAYAKESEIVNNVFVARTDTYNQVCGGSTSVDWNLERKLHYSQRLTGPNHPMWGKKHTEESNQKRRDKLVGKKRPTEVIEKGAAARRGRVSPLRGIPQSLESNLKRAESHKNLPKITCPICHKDTSPQNAARWHFDKCKPRRPKYAKDRAAVGWVESVGSANGALSSARGSHAQTYPRSDGSP